MKINGLSLSTGLLLAIISGAMVIPLSRIDSFNLPEILGLSLIDILIGAVFALLVMAPFQKHINWLRTLAMIVASIAIYTGVVQLAITHYHLFYLNMDYASGIILSGGLGALLTGLATQLLAPVQLTWKSYTALAILGLIAGYIFSVTIDSELIIINAIGFIIWQVLVFLSIYFSKNT
ncbi:MAG: hypothetical protein JKY19_06600 [Alcanivoracaceae bacterium]|nr:hypothetical protein [Alcanivoracaceae bacterium]